MLQQELIDDVFTFRQQLIDPAYFLSLRVEEFANTMAFIFRLQDALRALVRVGLIDEHMNTVRLRIVPRTMTSSIFSVRSRTASWGRCASAS